MTRLWSIDDEVITRLQPTCIRTPRSLHRGRLPLHAEVRDCDLMSLQGRLTHPVNRSSLGTCKSLAEFVGMTGRKDARGDEKPCHLPAPPHLGTFRLGW